MIMIVSTPVKHLLRQQRFCKDLDVGAEGNSRRVERLPGCEADRKERPETSVRELLRVREDCPALCAESSPDRCIVTGRRRVAVGPFVDTGCKKETPKNCRNREERY
jgi:hypothetical protein